MRKALFWMLMGFVLFALLVAGIFGYLSYNEKKSEEQAAAEEEAGTIPEVISKAERDSLVNLLSMKDSIITVRNNTNDSLSRLLANNKVTITSHEQTIDELKQQLIDKQDREENIKNLAKTYESLRVAEIGPILEDIGDSTLIDIYNQMSSRKRKNLIQALPPDRAANITNKLAGRAGDLPE